MDSSHALTDRDATRDAQKRRGASWLQRNCLPLAGVLAVAAFVLLVAPFWDAYYGFTRLLQFNAAAAEIAIPEIREQPIFIYPQHGGYDGLYYAQLAFHPLLDAPELATALDMPGVRARRMLTSGLAWVLAAGQPDRIAHIFAWINIGAWFALAAITWRLLPVRDARSWLAWAGLLFSAGVLHSVRQSLTDLPALVLLAGAMLAVERGWLRSSLGLLAAAALTRETMVLAAAGPVPHGRPTRSAIARWGVAAILIAAPLALWISYVRWRFGAADPGVGNFSWPLSGWIGKGRELLQAYEQPAFRWLITTSLLAAVGMTVQAAFLVVYRDIRDAWWRIGAVFLILALFLGRAVWEGHPGAYTRVLLPMSLAFAVCAVRRRVSLLWLLVGGLSVFAGLEPWRDVVHRPDEFGTGSVTGRGYLVRLDEGFSPREHTRGGARAWSSGRGVLDVQLDHAPDAETITVELEVRAFTPRTLILADALAERWSGALGTGWHPISVTLERSHGQPWRLVLASPEPPSPESPLPGARSLAFAVRNVRVVELR